LYLDYSLASFLLPLYNNIQIYPMLSRYGHVEDVSDLAGISYNVKGVGLET